ncbi:hypothetical protein BDN72DRAFT_899290 [Pluteus cervinus]|uniref:Uncharacterized protein n=1 Tax=Pluteus cervinus TaxID=181527 RepID=A0ACD3AN45_9AGAR|nr:hypothetical protein BDN72DRAFT_899290 [Pluteus cervinus]
MSDEIRNILRLVNRQVRELSYNLQALDIQLQGPLERASSATSHRAEDLDSQAAFTSVSTRPAPSALRGPNPSPLPLNTQGIATPEGDVDDDVEDDDYTSLTPVERVGDFTVWPTPNIPIEAATHSSTPTTPSPQRPTPAENVVAHTTMPTAAVLAGPWFCVVRGFHPGVTNSRDEVFDQIQGFNGALVLSCGTRSTADNIYESEQEAGHTSNKSIEYGEEY